MIVEALLTYCIHFYSSRKNIKGGNEPFPPEAVANPDPDCNRSRKVRSLDIL